MQTYLADYKQKHPELAEPIGELERLTKVIDEKYDSADRMTGKRIRTPDETAVLVETFRKDHLADTSPQAATACDKFTEELVSVGGGQDELAGECRQAVKVLRQQAGIEMAIDPRMAEVAKEIRKRSQEVMRTPAGHESPRH